MDGQLRTLSHNGHKSLVKRQHSTRRRCIGLEGAVNTTASSVRVPLKHEPRAERGGRRRGGGRAGSSALCCWGGRDPPSRSALLRSELQSLRTARPNPPKLESGPAFTFCAIRPHVRVASSCMRVARTLSRVAWTGKSHTRVAHELRSASCEIDASCVRVARKALSVNNKSVKMLIKVKRGDNNSRYVRQCPPLAKKELRAENQGKNLVLSGIAKNLSLSDSSA